MPKRSPTPPSTDDSQFLTVVNPYPDQPYEALEHSIIFARWIACVIGEENLLAFYHKPKVRPSSQSRVLSNKWFNGMRVHAVSQRGYHRSLEGRFQPSPSPWQASVVRDAQEAQQRRGSPSVVRISVQEEHRVVSRKDSVAAPRRRIVLVQELVSCR